MIGTVYELVANNGHRYIGSTIKELNVRLSKHYFLLERGEHHSIALQNAYNKYGKFNCNILETIEVETIKQLRDREQYYLDLFNPEYNISKNAHCAYRYKNQEDLKYVLTSFKFNGKTADIFLDLYSESTKVLFYIIIKRLCSNVDNVYCKYSESKLSKVKYDAGIAQLVERKIIIPMELNGIILKNTYSINKHFIII